MRPFGPVASIAWTILLLVAMEAVQGLVVIVVAAARNGARAGDGHPGGASVDGLLLSIATLASAPAVVALVALLAVTRRYPLRDYLALRLPTTRKAGLAVGGMMILMAASDSTSYLVGRPLVPSFMIDLYRTSPLLPLLLAVVVAGVIGEEVLFRGFLFEGIALSRWGPVAAILISALFWAAPHVQYDLYGVFTIALMGLYLGAVRFKTGSLPMTILLHALNNAAGLAEAAFFAHRAI
jgi:membrane protease YdiL (CAAX protease family)